MERNDFYIKLGEKLRKARKKVGMTQKEAAEQVGFENYQTLLSIEKGERPIQTWELLNLAQIYNQDTNYFLSNKWDQSEPEKILWRNKSESPKLKSAEQKFINYCKRYHFLEGKLGIKSESVFKALKKNEIVINDYDDAEELANKYNKKLNLGSHPSKKLATILEEKLQIKILYLALDGAGSGASTIGNFGPAILINSLDAPWRRNFDLAHEFFHLLTWNLFDPNIVHCYTDEKKKSREDKLADCFASSLLLPTSQLKEEFNKRIKDNKLSYLDSIMIAKEFGVSKDAMIWRLVNMNLIAQDSAKKALDSPELNIINWKQRKLEWGETPKFSDRYIRLAFYCYKKGFISRSKLAEYFDIKLAELSDFLLEKGLSEEGEYGIEFFAT
jgi:Zn-dependent peptidase ImmA (M78 family)/DNA-binding XRE family transcriptional regulator